VDSKQGLGGWVLAPPGQVYFLDAVAALEVEEVIAQAAKRLGVTYATASVLCEKIENGRDRAEIVVRLNMKFEPVFIHAPSITQPS
jgi:hypothetical protein